MIRAEVSLYPVETDESDDVIMRSLQSLENHHLQYDIGSLSTNLAGPPHEVWGALRDLYDRAQRTGNEVVMVVTISNGT